MKRIYFWSSILLLFIFSCKAYTLPCSSTAGNTNIRQQQITFTYSWDTEVFIDINKDGVDDFKCISESAGNRSRKLIVPIGEDNKLVGSDNVLGVGEIVDEHTTYSNRFDFNELGDGENAHLNNKFIGVKFKIKDCIHYGWIKFSSTTDGGENSNTPIYYLNVKLSIHETGYSEGYNKLIITK